MALPLGMAADRLGRIPILGLSVLSIFLSQGYAILICWKWKTVPIRAVWALGAPLLLGGGEAVSEAMVFTIISDVVPSIRRLGTRASYPSAIMACTDTMTVEQPGFNTSSGQLLQDKSSRLLWPAC